MIEVSNKDMSDVVVFLSDYYESEHHGSTREINKRRRALVLAKKLQKRLEQNKK